MARGLVGQTWTIFKWRRGTQWKFLLLCWNLSERRVVAVSDPSNDEAAGQETGCVRVYELI